MVCVVLCVLCVHVVLCVVVSCWCVHVVLCVRVCVVVCVCVLCVHVVLVKLGTRKTPLCVRSKRLRVYGQDVSVCTGNRPECLGHSGLLPVHTETS